MFAVAALVAAEAGEKPVRNQAVVGIGAIDFGLVTIAGALFHFREDIAGRVGQHLGIFGVKGAVYQRVLEVGLIDVDFLVVGFLRGVEAGAKIGFEHKEEQGLAFRGLANRYSRVFHGTLPFVGDREW